MAYPNSQPPMALVPPGTNPDSNAQYPPDNSMSSLPNPQYPPANFQNPLGSSPYPATNSQYPPNTAQCPPANPPYQSGNSPYPSANPQYPAGSSSYPYESSPYPPANSQYPPANAQYPPANSPYPSGASPYPATQPQHPTGNAQYTPANAPYPPSAQSSLAQHSSPTTYPASTFNVQSGGGPQAPNYGPANQQYEYQTQNSSNGSRSGLTSMALKMAGSKFKPIGLATQLMGPVLSGNTSSPQSSQGPFPTPVPRQTAPFVPSGRRKAVLVGVNYLNDPRSKLSGCINDANCMRYLLQSKFGFQAQNIVMMTDDSSDPGYQPTRHNILNGLGWLVSEAQQGDTLFFHFSGHGSQTRDRGGDEVDGMDETICPVDFKQHGMIVDDELHARLCARLPYGCRLIAVMDCCHSGTGLDLPYTYYRNSRGVIQPEVDQASIRKGNETVAQVVLFSSCKDSQTAADTKALAGGTYTGAATFSFIQAVEQQYPNLTFESLLDSMSRALKQKGYRQTAQLSAGHAMDLHIPFQM